MTALDQPTSPLSWTDIAKDIVIMVVLSAIIVGGLVILKEVLPSF